MIIADLARESSIALLGLLFVLPLFSTLFLILRGDSRDRLVFQIVALCLAVGVGLLFLLSYPFRSFLRLWGPWLYVGLAGYALILELALLSTGRRPAEG